MKSLQNQYNLIREGKGSKDTFLKSVKSLFPNYIPSHFGFNETVNILKEKSIISENIGGIVTNGNQTPPDWFKIFKETVSEAKAEEKNPTKEVTDTETTAFDYKDPKNIDNIYGPTFLKGFYTEMNNPKNENKTVDEIKSIVSKNLAKNITYYTEKGQFGLDGIGYQVEHPGLGTSKEAKGKYKSSGYGNLKESKTQLDPKIIQQIIDDIKGFPKYQTRGFESFKKEVRQRYLITPKQLEDILSGDLKENRDINDPVLMKFRANREQSKQRNQNTPPKPNPNQSKIDFLTKERERIMFDMEQEAELEGGPIADMYGDKLNKIDKALRKLKGINEGKTSNNPYKLYITHPEFKEAHQAISKILKTAKSWEEVQSVLNNYREVGADDTASREAIKSIFDKKPLNENEGGDFDGVGLVVTGRTQTDNNAISDMLDETDYHAVWNVREGYWFFPESEETLDSLEMELQTEFDNRDINARFEGQFNESLNEYFAFGVSEDEVKLKVAKQEAEKISREEGVVQHVNQKPSGEYEVSDWYDSETTVASYEFGQQINENMIKLKDLLEAEYYETFKEKEKKSTSKPKPKKAKTGDKIKAIETQGNIASLEAKIEALDEEIDSRETKMKMATENEEFKEFVNEKKVKAMEKEVKQLRKAQEKYLKEYKKCTGEDYQAKKEIVDETFED